MKELVAKQKISLLQFITVYQFFEISIEISKATRTQVNALTQ